MTVAVDYWPNYCEENIWRLCGEPREDDPIRRFAVFVSNTARSVALWAQRAAAEPDRPVIWDYHVVLLEELPAGWLVTDPDCTRSSPMPAAAWIEACFRALSPAAAAFAPEFRVVDAAEYRETLCSDRSHMRTAEGAWASPPPPWPCVGADGSNLMKFVDMREKFI